MKITINKKTWILSFIIVFLPLALSLEYHFETPLIGYADELFSLLMFGYLLLLTANRRLEHADEKILIILVVYTLIGLFSNVVSGLFNNIFYILLDALWQWKIFLAFLGAKYLSRKDRKGVLLRDLMPLAKILIVSAFCCAILSFGMDLGMTEGERYGIPAFFFVFGNHGRYGIIVAVALLVVILNESNRRKRNYYIVLALVDMIFSTKGVVYVIIPVFLLLWFVFSTIERKGKINTGLIVLIAIAGLSVSGYQVREYLLDETAPRALLLRYGFVTANEYFPLGSGFGTYGSDVAARFYSPLYVQYGWADKWKMGLENGSLLNDNYLATIVGECGYFGMILYIAALYLVYKQINNITAGPQEKALIMSIFVCMIVAFLATGILKSSIGMLTFVVLGIVVTEIKRGKDRVTV